MNFMSDRTGFCSDATGSRGMSSPSSSSSSNRGGLPLYTHHYGGGGAGDDESDDHMAVAAVAEPVEKEHMFDKVVTPSDVGKLNRLVIPKQHAEKYFPLDAAANEKGLLLNFEDRNGKQWRFRYSYWNSSQSYVMTKGWSRFVKEKKLDAGDIVTFQRGAGDSGRDRLFIEWRRRPDAPDLLRPPHPPIPTLSIPHHYLSSFHRPLFLHPPSSRDHNLLQYSNGINNYQNNNYYYNNQQSNGPNYAVVDGNPCVPGGSIMYLRSGQSEIGWQRGVREEQMVYESVPVVQGKAAAKRLRLFGVNMDCPISSDSSDNNNSTIIPIHHNFFDFTPSLPPPHPPPSSIPSSDDKGKGSMSLDLDI